VREGGALEFGYSLLDDGVAAVVCLDLEGRLVSQDAARYPPAGSLGPDDDLLSRASLASHSASRGTAKPRVLGWAPSTRSVPGGERSPKWHTATEAL